MDTPSFNSSHSFNLPDILPSTNYNFPMPDPLPSASDTIQTHAPAPLHHSTRVIPLARTGGGIFCASPTCTTSKGIPAAGSKGCSRLMCKRCCQQHAENALRNNMPIPECHERRHNIKPGHAPIHRTNLQVPGPFAPLALLGHTVSAVPESQMDQGATAAHSATAAPPTSIGIPTANYAQPLSDMWRPVTQSWLNEKQRAAKQYDQRTADKKNILEKQKVKQQQIDTISYIAEDKEGISLPLALNSHTRDIRIAEYHDLMDLLGLHDCDARFDVYNSSEDRWDSHTSLTVITLAKDEPLLLRKLPHGLGGPRLSVERCIGLNEELEKLRSRRAKGRSIPSGSVSLPKRPRSDSSTYTPPAAKSARTSSTPTAPRHSTLPSESTLIVPATQVPTQTAAAHDREQWSPPPIEQVIHDAMGLNMRNVRLFGAKPHRSDGYTKWPSPFSIHHVITGVEKVKNLAKQPRQPRLTQEKAFELVYGKRVHYNKSTFQAIAALLGKNSVLVEKHRLNEDLPWPDFVQMARPKVDGSATAGGEVIDVDADGDLDTVGDQVQRSQSGGGGGDSEDEVEFVDSEDSGGRAVRDHLGDDGDGEKHGGSENDDPLHPECLHAPSNLCPYCDEILPAKPSTKFLAELEYYNESPRSYADPTEENPYHRSTRPVVACAALCEIHRVELAVQNDVTKGWPSEIRSATLKRKIRSLDSVLRAIIANPTSSIFYKKMQKMISKMGLRHAFGFQGNTRFCSTYGQGAAYYGVKGLEIMQDTLQDMYPNHLYGLDIGGVSYTQFLGRVLVPETTHHLIQQERHLTSKAARKIMRESFRYGDIMFSCNDPSFTDGEDGDEFAPAGTGNMNLASLLNSSDPWPSAGDQTLYAERLAAADWRIKDVRK